jgi:uncharacterized transporter YbjL
MVGLVVGLLIGLFVVRIGDVPLTLGAGGGALIRSVVWLAGAVETKFMAICL